MSRVLVLYGTTDGHTARIARFLALELESFTAQVDVIESRSLAADPMPDGYDGVIVAASVHAHGYQRAVRRWIGAHARALGEKRTAFLSVSLGVLQQDPKVQQDVSAIVQGFLDRNEWRPTFVKSVAGALPYSRYGFFKRLVMRRIAAKAGGGTDTSKDYEYTDWNDLRSFAVEFYRSLPGQGAGSCTLQLAGAG